MRIKNARWGQLIVSVGGGKSLSLPGRGIEEISDEDFQSAEVQRLTLLGDIVVLPEEQEQTADKAHEPEQPGEGSESSQPAASQPKEDESGEPH